VPKLNVTHLVGRIQERIEQLERDKQQLRYEKERQRQQRDNESKRKEQQRKSNALKTFK
jgi:hypothetical protein